MTEYDRVAYPNYTHPQTHPDRLAVIGSLFGLDPAPAGRCRVLEVGCGDAGNLAPMAAALPQSEFVGIDLAEKPIARAQQMAREAGISNLRLVCANILDLDGGWGRFDYIIAHGFYSWAPKEAREHLLASCRKLLAPQGIAYISYNAYPGCHLRMMLREQMLFHVRGFASPEERTRQALALARFLARAQNTRDGCRLWMKAEFEHILEHAPGHLYHDELAEINDPLYFTQFMEQAARHDLQYLGEADFFEMFDHALDEPTRAELARLASNRWLREQYLDFVKCRRFRQTLLCHKEAQLATEPVARRVANFLVSSSAVPVRGEDAGSSEPASASRAGVKEAKTKPQEIISVDLRAGVNYSFQNPKGFRCQTDLPLGKAALLELGQVWPRPLPFEELFERAEKRLKAAGIASSPQDSRTVLCDFLLRLYAGGGIEFRATLPAMTFEVSDKPAASRLARWQAARGQCVASLFHMPIQVEDEIGRSLLIWLDGTLNRAELVEKVWELLRSRKALRAGADGGSTARVEIETQLQKNLEKLARLGLLVG